MHQLVLQSKPGFTYEDLWEHDRVHPSDRGHGFLAYCVLEYLTMIDRQVICSPQEPVRAVSVSRIPPLFRHNDKHKGSCSRGEALKKQVLRMSSDWAWEAGEKAGFYSTTPGASLILTLPEHVSSTEAEDGLPNSNDTDTSGNVFVNLGVQLSWRAYGMASVQCLDGCACEELVVDLYDAYRGTTTQELFDFTLHRIEGAGLCAIEITVLDETNSDGHFVKVMSLAVTDL